MIAKARIVISVETLLTGGAESFAVRLANSVCSQFNVFLVIIQGNMIDATVMSKLKPEVHLIQLSFPFEWLIGKFDSALLRLRIDFSLRNKLVVNRVRSFLLRKQIEIIHTNQFKVDYVFSLANQYAHIPHLITIHGDYLNFSERSNRKDFRILHFQKKAIYVLQLVDKIVYISDHQYDFITSEMGLSLAGGKSVKIYNGVEWEGQDSGHVRRKGFLRKDFVFGMVARGIREKGWEEAIRAFEQLKALDIQLVLVGNSKYLDELEKDCTNENIFFAGYSENPMEWISLFDVGLLPSTFASESLPTSVIEYIMMGKPVIASDKGEIRKMIENKSETCGIVLAVKENQIAEHELVAAMELLLRDKELYYKMAASTKKFAAYFDMKNCADAYIGVYHSLMQSRS